MNKSTETCLINLAIHRASREFNSITKNRKGYKYEYADLSQITKEIRGPMHKNDLLVNHSTEVRHHLDDTGALSHWSVAVTTRITHTMSGQYIENKLQGPPRTNPDIQVEGGDISYLRRYNILAMLDLTVEEDIYDNDGQSSGEITAAVNLESEQAYAELVAELNSSKSTAELARAWKKNKAVIGKLDESGLARVTKIGELIKEKFKEAA
jgi:hypothetical protein